MMVTLEDTNEPIVCCTPPHAILLCRPPSSASCSVVEAVSTSINKALACQPSANVDDKSADNEIWEILQIITDQMFVISFYKLE